MSLYDPTFDEYARNSSLSALQIVDSVNLLTDLYLLVLVLSNSIHFGSPLIDSLNPKPMLDLFVIHLLKVFTR